MAKLIAPNERLELSEAIKLLESTTTALEKSQADLVALDSEMAIAPLENLNRLLEKKSQLENLIALTQKRIPLIESRITHLEETIAAADESFALEKHVATLKSGHAKMAQHVDRINDLSKALAAAMLEYAEFLEPINQSAHALCYANFKRENPDSLSMIGYQAQSVGGLGSVQLPKIELGIAHDFGYGLELGIYTTRALQPKAIIHGLDDLPWEKPAESIVSASSAA
jgi:hypothetical protein